MSPLASRRGDEVGGIHHPPRGVSPPDQGLDSGETTRVEIDFGLVDEVELFVDERVSEVTGEFDGRRVSYHGPTRPRVEELEVVATLPSRW
jgi:hypothetical protein